MTRKRKKILIALPIVIVALTALTTVHYFFRSAVTHETQLLIPSGSTFDQLSDSVRSNRAFRSGAFLRIARRHGLPDNIHPGRYVFKPGMSYAEVIRRLKTGRQTPQRVTFNNIRTLDRLSAVLGRKLEADSATLRRLLADSAVTARYGYTPQTIMAMFIPNTYELYWNCRPNELFGRMKEESEKFWKERTAKLPRTGLSHTEAITLASIVYEETKRKEEMPIIAGVYLNRLRIGMPLQADPTIKFALGNFALKRVLREHLTVDSPYNTYTRQGLPPGPICMPSIDAIDAVLDFQKNDYLYFCAKDDLSGAHNFAHSLAEHHRNAAAYTRALNRLNIK